MEVNIEALALRIADDLQLEDRDIELLKQGDVPYGWSNAVMENLSIMYDLEDKIINELIK